MANRKDRSSFRYQAKYKPQKSRFVGDDPLLTRLTKELIGTGKDDKAAK